MQAFFLEKLCRCLLLSASLFRTRSPSVRLVGRDLQHQYSFHIICQLCNCAGPLLRFRGLHFHRFAVNFAASSVNARAVVFMLSCLGSCRLLVAFIVTLLTTHKHMSYKGYYLAQCSFSHAGASDAGTWHKAGSWCQAPGLHCPLHSILHRILAQSSSASALFVRC